MLKFATQKSTLQTLALVTSFMLLAHPSLAASHGTKSYDYKLDFGRRAPISIVKSSETTDWLVLMPGSGCDFYEIGESHFLRWLMAERPYNVLLIGKAGADLGGSANQCRVDEFQHSSVRSQRIQDVQTIMHDLIPAQARILLSAISEGAYIAPDVALADSRVRAYIDLSGNTNSWMTEELMCVQEGPDRDKLAQFFDNEVRGNNSFTKYYVDWTYAYLNSYDTRRSFDVMKSLTIPIIWLNGDHDTTLWVEGARKDAMALIHDNGKSNIEYHWLLGAEHGLECSKAAQDCDEKILDEEVRSLMTDFAAKNFSL